MKLTLEQIKTITVGALNIWEENEVFRFAKCTQKQVDAWYKLEDILGFRAETTSGVRLDFYTNSSFFRFTPQIKGTFERYEVYIDNVFLYHFDKTDFEVNTRKEIVLDDKEHRITLYLPGHEIGTLESVEIEDGATLAAHQYDCKMLFIGDSITQGWESTFDSLSYAHHVTRFFNAESVIQGIGGGFYHETIFDEAIQFEPDIVVIAYGTNDWQKYPTIEAGREQCSRFLDLIVKRYGDKKIFGISPIWREEGVSKPLMGSFQMCCSYVKDEIKKHGIILIEGETLVPHLGEFFVEDMLHPNMSGFGIYALNLTMQMQKYLD